MHQTNDMITFFLSILVFVPILILFFLSLPVFSSGKTQKVYNGIMLSLSSALIGRLVSGIWIGFNDGFEVDIFNSSLGLTLRVDSLSILIFTMISIIALVVIKFSNNYLDGEPRKVHFLNRMAFTIGFVVLFVVSGNLIFIAIAWVGTSLGLQRLLAFHKDRKKARLAARKKFIVARLGDTTLITAFSLIYIELGTGNLTEIFTALKTYNAGEIPLILEISGLLIALSAALKSVQIPSHVWLLEVMETPTPVSALLHAGLLNAGPFLIIRFAFFIDLTSYATTLLMVLGAASAIYGALSSTTQPSVKNALAYSSVGHMGFTLMLSGLGVYSASLLHLVAHSFYKAHAFLSSGSAIETTQLKVARSEEDRKKLPSILVGLIFAGAIFIVSSELWHVNTETDFQLLLIGGIIFLGVASLQIHTWTQRLQIRAILRLMFLTALVINAFYFLENVFALQLAEQIPEIREVSLGLVILGITIFTLFTVAVVSRSWIEMSSQDSFMKKLEIHFRNGLYFNHFMNRMMNSLALKKSR